MKITKRFPHQKNQDNRHIILCHCCKIHSHNQQCRFECCNEHLSIQNHKCTAHCCHNNHENCIWLNNRLICCNKKWQHDVHSFRNAFITAWTKGRHCFPSVNQSYISPIGQGRQLDEWPSGKIPVLSSLGSQAGGVFMSLSQLYVYVGWASIDNNLTLKVPWFPPSGPQDTLQDPCR